MVLDTTLKHEITLILIMLNLFENTNTCNEIIDFIM